MTLACFGLSLLSALKLDPKSVDNIELSPGIPLVFQALAYFLSDAFQTLYLSESFLTNSVTCFGGGDENLRPNFSLDPKIFFYSFIDFFWDFSSRNCI